MKLHLWLALPLVVFLHPRALAEPRPMDLDTAIELGIAHSWGLRSLESRHREASAECDASLALGMPKVSADATYARLSKEVNSLVGENTGMQNSPDTISKVSLAVEQPLTELGNSHFLGKARRKEMQRLDAERRRLSLSIAFSVSESFISKYKAEKLVEIAEASVKLAETQLEDTRALERFGKATGAEILKLTMALSDAQSQLAQARAGAEISDKILLTLLGLPPDVDLTLQWAENDPMERFGPQADLARAERQRPEFLQFHLAKESLEAMLDNQRISWLPKASLFAKYERDFAQDDVTVPGGHRHDPQSTATAIVVPERRFPKADVRDSFSFGLNVNWTIFDGGLRGSERAELLERQLRISHEESQFREEMVLSLAQADSQLGHLQASLKFARAARDSAEEFYRQQRIKFANGVATATDLVAAERDLTRARNAEITAEADLRLAHIKKSYLLGEIPSFKSKRRT